jgi:NitT/TauT family transport system substrate-binding protein
MQSFSVIDALFMDERFVNGREDDYRELLTIFNRALDQFKRDPHEYYETIHGYLEGQSYQEFMNSTTQIQWLNSGTHPIIETQLRTQHIETTRLLH